MLLLVKQQKEAVWLKKLLSDLGVVRIEQVPITLFCDNSGAVAQSKDPRITRKESTFRESTTSLEILLLVEMWWQQRLKVQII